MKPFNLLQKIASLKIFSFLHTSGIARRNNYITKALKFDPSALTLFDTSCGDGVLLQLVHQKFPQLSITAIDLDSKSTENAKKLVPSAEIVTSSIDDYQTDKRFDIVFSSMTLHHVKDSKTFFKRISELLDDAGTVVLIDVISKGKNSKKLLNFVGCPAQYHFENFFTVSEICELGKGVGLEIKSSQLISKFPSVFCVELKKQIKNDTI